MPKLSGEFGLWKTGVITNIKNTVININYTAVVTTQHASRGPKCIKASWSWQNLRQNRGRDLKALSKWESDNEYQSLLLAEPRKVCSDRHLSSCWKKKSPTSFQFSAKAVFIGAICWKFLKNWWSQDEPHDKKKDTLYCIHSLNTEVHVGNVPGMRLPDSILPCTHLGLHELQCLLASSFIHSLIHSFIQRGSWVVCQPCVKKQACEEVWPANQPVGACAPVDLLNVVSTLE